MRVLHLCIVIGIIAVIALAGMAWFDAAPLPFLNEMAWGVKGYGPAKTPEEAVEKYNKAMGKRDFEAAARFVYSDDKNEYQRKFKKVAKPAKELAVDVDNFRSIGTDLGYLSDKVDKLLWVCDPFPKSLHVKENIKESEGGEVAIAKVEEEYASEKQPKVPREIHLRKTDGKWRIEFNLDDHVVTYYIVANKDEVFQAPQTTRRQHLDALEKHGRDLAKGVNVVKNDMKSDATTKNDVFAALKDQIQQAMDSK